MNKLMIAALTVFAAGAALADDPTIDNSASVPSLKTRAQVIAEYQQGKVDGSINAWSNRPQLNKAQDIKSVRTRAEVRADVIAARATDACRIERPKVELGIVIAGLRRLLVARGHCPIGGGVGNGRAQVGQHSEAAGNDDNSLRHGPRNRGAKRWPR